MPAGGGPTAAGGTGGPPAAPTPGGVASAAAGNPVVTVTLTDAYGNVVPASTSAEVAPLLEGAGTNLSANPGQSFQTVLAVFSDGDATATAASFSAHDDWGDGQTSVGTVTL